MPDATARVRNVRFAIGPQTPRHWLGGRRSVTSFFDNLSVSFPAGERFFVASVRACEHVIVDDELRRAVAIFYGQEGAHRREHLRYNAMLRAQGYPVDAMERRIVRLLRVVSTLLPARSRLAVTCAVEHFTALMGQMILADERVLDGADPVMAALWRWHAAEENEHKAVAYDVFLAAGGTYAERVAIMAAATVVFAAKVVDHQARLMNADGTLFSLREWAALARFLFVSPGAMRGLLRPYLAWYRPGFHPDDLEWAAPLDDWRREFDSSATYGGVAQGARGVP